MRAWVFARRLIPGPLRGVTRRLLRATLGRVVLWGSTRSRPPPPLPELADAAADMERVSRASRCAVVRAVADLERRTRRAGGAMSRVVVNGDDSPARVLAALARDLGRSGGEPPVSAPEVTEVIVWKRDS